MELLVPAALGPELYTELGGHAPGEKPQGLLLGVEVTLGPFSSDGVLNNFDGSLGAKIVFNTSDIFDNCF